MNRQHRRFDRQYARLSRSVPLLGGTLHALATPRYRLVRLPAAILLILGSFLAILPGFGLWMLPLGLMLLAVDVPALRPAMSAAGIRLRRWLRRWRPNGASR
jgi:hypothetical protein